MKRFIADEEGEELEFTSDLPEYSISEFNKISNFFKKTVNLYNPKFTLKLNSKYILFLIS
jgi:hypothetical protein